MNYYYNENINSFVKKYPVKFILNVNLVVSSILFNKYSNVIHFYFLYELTYR